MFISQSVIPTNEAQRLAAVQRYAILDTPPEQTFERITKLAARFFNVPIAIISIVDRDRIWFKSHHGLDLEQIDRDLGLCAAVILQNDIYAVIDAKTDPRTATSPLVAEEFGWRFYAAAPLRTAAGFNIGTIAVIDFSPREITAAEQETLKDLAAIAINQLDLRLLVKASVVFEVTESMQILQESEPAKPAALSETVTLTGLKNRHAFDLKLEWYALQASQHGSDAAVVLIELDGLKVLNDTMGENHGNILLQAFASALRSGFREADIAYHFGGEKFALLLPLRGKEDFNSLKQSLEQRLENALRQTRQVVRIGASAGLAMLSEVNGLRHEAVHLANARMQVEKLKNRYAVRRMGN